MVKKPSWVCLGVTDENKCRQGLICGCAPRVKNNPTGKIWIALYWLTVYRSASDGPGGPRRMERYLWCVKVEVHIFYFSWEEAALSNYGVKWTTQRARPVASSKLSKYKFLKFRQRDYTRIVLTWPIKKMSEYAMLWILGLNTSAVNGIH